MEICGTGGVGAWGNSKWPQVGALQGACLLHCAHAPQASGVSRKPGVPQPAARDTLRFQPWSCLPFPLPLLSPFPFAAPIYLCLNTSYVCLSGVAGEGEAVWIPPVPPYEALVTYPDFCPGLWQRGRCGVQTFAWPGSVGVSLLLPMACRSLSFSLSLPWWHLGHRHCLPLIAFPQSGGHWLQRGRGTGALQGWAEWVRSLPRTDQHRKEQGPF